MTGTNCDLFTHKSSRSYLNHLVHSLGRDALREGFDTTFTSSFRRSLVAISTHKSAPDSFVHIISIQERNKITDTTLPTEAVTS